MRPCFVPLVFGLLIASAAAFEERTLRVEHSKPLPDDSGLGTTVYAPSAVEKKVIEDWKPAELNSGGMEIEKLTGNVGKRVAWFGIVREVKEDKQADMTRLLVEMKYFDGFTDLHQQIVSISGAGDFSVSIPAIGHQVKLLSLVRVYGKVSAEKDGTPDIQADFVRCWDWKLFAFMPYGQDRSNPKWVKLRKADKDDTYTSRPTDRYYEAWLGKR